MPVPSDWIEHRRGDRELLGWMRPSGDGFVAIDLLGREISGALDWLAAEELLDDLGIGYLADPYELMLQNGTWIRVRLLEVSADRIRLKKDDWGDMSVPQVEFVVEFPIPERLRIYSSVISPVTTGPAGA
jgi:hypothetical protein